MSIIPLLSFTTKKSLWYSRAMADVEFNEAGQEFNHAPSSITQGPQVPTLVRLIIKIGITKNAKIAYAIFIGIGIVCIIATLAILSTVNVSKVAPLPLGAKLITPYGEPPRLESPVPAPLP
jgi:hypothetical protein